MSWYKLLLLPVAFFVLLFVPAGRLDLPWFWALFVAQLVLTTWGYLRLDAGLVRERLNPGEGGVDRALPHIGRILIVAHFILASLDAGRFNWSGTFPVWVHAAGFLLYISSSVLAFQAMAVNLFFSPVVRIQDERGHHLIESGPYHWMRHPGYAGLAGGLIGGGLTLGSLVSLLPAAILVLLFLRRTLIEDQYLTDHLPGYPEYRKRTPARWIPGVW